MLSVESLVLSSESWVLSLETAARGEGRESSVYFGASMTSGPYMAQSSAILASNNVNVSVSFFSALLTYTRRASIKFSS
jgi:hypothetical protein